MSKVQFKTLRDLSEQPYLPNVYRPRVKRKYQFPILSAAMRGIFYTSTMFSLCCLSVIGGLRFGIWTVRTIQSEYAELNRVEAPQPPPPVRWPDNFDPRDADGVYPD